MLKLKKALSERLPPLILYIEDVDSIYQIFSEVNPDVRISTADYAFENLEELKESGLEKTHYLSIEITEPNISLKLEPYLATLQCDDDTAVQRGTIEKIKSVLLHRKRNLTKFLQSGVLAGVCVGFSAWYLIPGLADHDVRKITIGLTTFLVGLVWSWWAIVRSHTVYPTIYISQRRTPPRFWEARKDEIILAIIAAIVGSVITLLISKLL